MKFSASIRNVETIYSFDDVETAEHFYEMILEAINNCPVDYGVKVFRNEDAVTMITDKAFNAIFMKEYDD